MAIIHTKIHEYNKETQSIVVSFASDTTKSQNPDDYEKFNYDISSLVEKGASEQDLKDALATSGLSWCENYCKKEMLDDRPEKQAEIEGLVQTSWTQEVVISEEPDAELDVEKLKIQLGL